MKNKNARKPRVAKVKQVEKPHRGQPKLSEAEKAADPIRAIKAEIKANLKRYEKARKGWACF